MRVFASVCVCVFVSQAFSFLAFLQLSPRSPHLLAASCLWHGGVVPHRGEYQRICVLVCASSLNFLSVCVCVCECGCEFVCVCAVYLHLPRELSVKF